VTRRRLAPYLLMAPGLLWLALFFVLPNIQMLVMSLSTRAGGTGLRKEYELTWAFENYAAVLTGFPAQFGNSLIYGGLATLLCFLIGFPLAYGIAFRGGRYKNVLLFLVIAPFFTSFLIRTISWKILLGNDGPALAILRDTLGIVPDNFNLVNTPLAVVSGLTYQFLPFMVLPLYVALEKVDLRLVEAARDLYAGPWRRGGAIVGGIGGALLATVLLTGLGYVEATPAGLVTAAVPILAIGIIGALVMAILVSEAFVRVIFPLSLSGIFAGSILTFIPAIGDYVNAELLGTTKTQMIGNVIQNRYLAQNDYPTAAALSFLLMAAILIAILVYARVLGTEELTGGRG
jgi:spermidine/putrescine transport system permease protein